MATLYIFFLYYITCTILYDDVVVVKIAENIELYK
jgi:hypothetical protein